MAGRTQRGRRPEGRTRPSVVRALRARQDPARSEPSVSVKSRHKPVPQPEGQSATRPECLITHPCPGCFSRLWASRSSSRGRGVGLVFLLCAPSFSSLFFRFSVLFSRVLSRSRRCAVATPAIRGVSRVVVPHLLVAVRFLPTSRGQWHHEHRSGIISVRSPLVRCYLWLYLPMFWDFGHHQP